MWLHVQAYHNPSEEFLGIGMVELVGSVMAEVEQAPTYEEVCDAVYSLMTDRHDTSDLMDPLIEIRRTYRRENLRDMRTGDVIVIWTQGGMYEGLAERTYVVTADGFRLV